MYVLFHILIFVRFTSIVITIVVGYLSFLPLPLYTILLLVVYFVCDLASRFYFAMQSIQIRTVDIGYTYMHAHAHIRTRKCKCKCILYYVDNEW